MVPVKNKSGSRLSSTPLAAKKQFYPKTSEPLNNQRDPQEWIGALKRLSSSDMYDNPTTREETSKKIERKEKPQHLAQKLARDIFC